MAAVPITGVDHLYLETRSFDEAVAFWERLGFTLTQRWGQDGHTAGRLESGGTFVVLAESADPVLNVHFGVAEAQALADALGQPLEQTHWGARLIRVQDPDGRTFVLEETR
jgi:catechol 2,3-dioxygenase-like lactoylglutathione lyase family enzyme